MPDGAVRPGAGAGAPRHLRLLTGNDDGYDDDDNDSHDDNDDNSPPHIFLLDGARHQLRPTRVLLGWPGQL